ncbi:MAG: flavodoxin family protein [Thomasclavelia sp.]
MKKVVIISSSPRRKGNSELLCDQFARGAKGAGLEVTKINLNDYTLYPCLACNYCRKHENNCFQKDDANFVIQQMIDSDVWLLASPVYFYSITAQLKLLIDRFYAREYEIRESNKRKKVYYLLTSGAPDLTNHQGAIESMRGFIQVLRTIDEGGIINGAGAFDLNDALKHPAYLQAYTLGKQIND